MQWLKTRLNIYSFRSPPTKAKKSFNKEQKEGKKLVQFFVHCKYLKLLLHMLTNGSVNVQNW